MILSYTLILPMLQLQIHQLITSQIKSRIEYLTETYTILLLILYLKLMTSVAELTVFNAI